MSLPQPKKEELESNFLNRCMNDTTMTFEYKDPEQRVSICNTVWANNELNSQELNEDITMKIEHRSFPVSELRATTNSKGKVVITGYAAVFNSLSGDLGGFREKIAEGAFSNALANSDTRAMWQHNREKIIGRKSAGTLRLSQDTAGLKIEIDPPDWASGYVESINRGDVSEMSFGFVVERDEWEDTDSGKIRTLLEIRELPDVSPVTFPAYPATSVDVALRSLDVWTKLNNNELRSEPDADAPCPDVPPSGETPMRKADDEDTPAMKKLRQKQRKLNLKTRRT